jgi:hypothetical protein
LLAVLVSCVMVEFLLFQVMRAALFGDLK